MYVYSIPMKFRYASGDIDYLKYSAELGDAQNVFNTRADKMKKARKITEINYEKEGFIIILESQDKLQNPSKALAVFSQALAKMSTLARFKDSQNHLLCHNGSAIEIERDEVEFNDSISEILKTIIDIFMGASISDNAFVSSGRKEARKKIIEACRDFKLSKIGGIGYDVGNNS